MIKRQSGLETWSDINNFGSSPKKIEGALPIILSLGGALGVAPFAILRFVNGEYLVAVLDLIMITGMLLLGFFVYRTRKVRLASIALSIFCVIGVLASVYVSGPRQILWAYPGVMVIFYLLRPVEAVALILAMISGLLPALLVNGSSFHTTSVIITLLVMGAFAYAFSAVANQQRAMLMQLATKDPLTGAGNRRALDSKLDELIAAFARLSAPSSLIILDLDHFKAVNDNHGHAKGDEILRRITEIVNLRIRVTDSLYRIGGEEFVVVVEHLGIEKASHLAEQLRTLVEANELVPDHSVTISLGVAEIQQDETGSEWLCRADKALYKAKRMGRNVTAIAE